MITLHPTINCQLFCRPTCPTQVSQDVTEHEDIKLRAGISPLPLPLHPRGQGEGPVEDTKGHPKSREDGEKSELCRDSLGAVTPVTTSGHKLVITENLSCWENGLQTYFTMP